MNFLALPLDILTIIFLYLNFDNDDLKWLLQFRQLSRRARVVPSRVPLRVRVDLLTTGQARKLSNIFGNIVALSISSEPNFDFQTLKRFSGLRNLELKSACPISKLCLPSTLTSLRLGLNLGSNEDSAPDGLFEAVASSLVELQISSSSETALQKPIVLTALQVLRGLTMLDALSVESIRAMVLSAPESLTSLCTSQWTAAFTLSKLTNLESLVLKKLSHRKSWRTSDLPNDVSLLTKLRHLDWATYYSDSAKLSVLSKCTLLTHLGGLSGIHKMLTEEQVNSFAFALPHLRCVPTPLALVSLQSFNNIDEWNYSRVPGEIDKVMAVAPTFFGSLRSLQLSHAPITQTQFNYLCTQYCSSLEEIGIPWTRSIISLHAIVKCSRLTLLDVSTSRVSATSAIHISALSRLTSLNISGTSISCLSLKNALFKHSLSSFKWAISWRKDHDGFTFEDINIITSFSNVQKLSLPGLFPIEYARILFTAVRYRSFKCSHPSDELIETLVECVTNRKCAISTSLKKVNLFEVSATVPRACWKKLLLHPSIEIVRLSISPDLTAYLESFKRVGLFLQVRPDHDDGCSTPDDYYYKPEPVIDDEAIEFAEEYDEYEATHRKSNK